MTRSVLQIYVSLDCFFYNIYMAANESPFKLNHIFILHSIQFIHLTKGNLAPKTPRNYDKHFYVYFNSTRMGAGQLRRGSKLTASTNLNVRKTWENYLKFFFIFIRVVYGFILFLTFYILSWLSSWSISTFTYTQRTSKSKMQDIRLKLCPEFVRHPFIVAHLLYGNVYFPSLFSTKKRRQTTREDHDERRSLLDQEPGEPKCPDTRMTGDRGARNLSDYL